MTEGVQVPTVLLPRPGSDLHRWAVIACDQFTSEPEYWAEVAGIVGDAPSAYHITLPEVYLDTPEEPVRVQSIRDTMHDYLDQGLFEEFSGIVLVERTVVSTAGRGGSHTKTRHGIMLALDLEQYDYSKGSTSLIRATEGTILERIPPRVRIRSGAPLELPHILVLIDDPGGSVIEPLVAQKAGLRQLYDFDLMLGSGHLSGYAVEEAGNRAHVLAALADLGQPETFAAKYGLPAGTAPLVYAMGDGNHSLATAKAIWEDLKRAAGDADALGADHPARYALVEVENIHDEGLEFEPIFRVLFDVKQNLAEALDLYYPDRYRLVPVASTSAMKNLVDNSESDDTSGSSATHAIGVFSPAACHVLYVSAPPSNLPVGTLQSFLDAWGQGALTGAPGFGKIDYVHGLDVTERLGLQAGNLGFYLPAIDKSSFFKTVIVDGALPRKTFSMGEAKEKRFYLEARRIV